MKKTILVIIILLTALWVQGQPGVQYGKITYTIIMDTSMSATGFQTSDGKEFWVISREIAEECAWFRDNKEALLGRYNGFEFLAQKDSHNITQQNTLLRNKDVEIDYLKEEVSLQRENTKAYKSLYDDESTENRNLKVIVKTNKKSTRKKIWTYGIGGAALGFIGGVILSR